MILLVPSVIIALMYFMFTDVPVRPGAPSPFNNACLIMLGVFPLIVMFLITSITMQRERVSGTLERILTTPLRRLDLLAAYGTAFSLAAAAQATLACLVSFWLLGLDTAGSPVWVFTIAIINAVLGVGLGLHRIPGGPIHAAGDRPAVAVVRDHRSAFTTPRLAAVDQQCPTRPLRS